jgi:hypothetical protein
MPFARAEDVVDASCYRSGRCRNVISSLTSPSAWRTRMLTGALVGVHVLLLGSVLRVGAALQKPTAGESWTVRVYHDVARTSGPGADLFALYHAGVNASRGLSVYDASEHREATPYFYPYRYLPVAAHTFGRALALLPPRVAYVVWVLFTELMLVLVVAAFRRASQGRASRTWGTAILLLSVPYWLELYMGQFTFVAVSLTCLAVLAWTPPYRQTGASTVLLSLAALLKVFPLVTLPAFLGRRAGLMLSMITISIVTLTNAPLFLGDPASGDAFWSKNFLGEAVGLDAGNHSILYVVFLAGQVFGGAWSLPMWGAVTILWRVAVLAGSAAAVLRARGLPVPIGASTLLLAHFVSYFQVWEHHFSAAILAGLLLCLGFEGAGRLRERSVALVATAALALPTPFPWLPSDPSTWNWLQRVLPPLAKAIPLLLLFGTALFVVGGYGTARRQAEPSA